MGSVKRFWNGALLSLAVLTFAQPLLAQSDTLEVRPSDPQPRAASSDTPSFSEQKRIVKSSIELWEQRVRKKLDEIDTIFQDLDLQQIQAQKVAVGTLLEILDDLDEEAQAIVHAHQQVGADLRLHREALLKAPSVFQKLADRLEDAAAEKSSTFLNEAYADFAAEARTLAASYEKKAAGTCAWLAQDVCANRAGPIPA